MQGTFLTCFEFTMEFDHSNIVKLCATPPHLHNFFDHFVDDLNLLREPSILLQQREFSGKQKAGQWFLGWLHITVSRSFLPIFLAAH